MRIHLEETHLSMNYERDSVGKGRLRKQTKTVIISTIRLHDCV